MLESLPLAAEGLTVAVLADLHADKLTRADRVAAMVARVNAVRPGLIVLLGDWLMARWPSMAVTCCRCGNYRLRMVFSGCRGTTSIIPATRSGWIILPLRASPC